MGLRASAHDAVALALRRRYGSVDALLTDSGTSALILALRKILPPGGTVAYPAYACIDLTTAALGAGVRVRLYDVDPATLSPDLDSVRAAIRRGVDAIVVAHLYGYPADMIGVRKLAAERGIPVIEDAAQGAGGTLGGALLGSIGDVAILSFARGKGTTGGSGGAVLVKTPALAEWTCRARSELQAGSRGGREVLSLAAQRLLSHPYLYRLPASIPGLKLGEMVFHPPRIPRAMAAASVAVLRRTLGLEVLEVSGRRARARNLLSSMSEMPDGVAVRPIPGGESGFLRLALIDTAGTRVPRADLGALRGYPMTLEQHPQLRPLLHSGERAGKGSQFLRDRLFTVPTHSRVEQSDRAGLAEWLDGNDAEPRVLISVP
jgi:perosamine synthetase